MPLEQWLSRYKVGAGLAGGHWWSHNRTKPVPSAARNDVISIVIVTIITVIVINVFFVSVISTIMMTLSSAVVCSCKRIYFSLFFFLKQSGCTCWILPGSTLGPWTSKHQVCSSLRGDKHDKLPITSHPSLSLVESKVKIIFSRFELLNIARMIQF